MYYRAEIYIDSVVRHSFIAGSLKVLKDKAEPYLKDEKITQIVVSEVNEIGFFKLPKGFEECLEDKLIIQNANKINKGAIKVKVLAKCDGFDITKGKIYEAIEHDGEYFVTDDTGEQYLYSKDYFEVIEK